MPNIKNTAAHTYNSPEYENKSTSKNNNSGKISKYLKKRDWKASANLEHYKKNSLEMKKALDESYYFTEQITETTPNILFIYDIIEQKTIYINSAIERLLGFSTALFYGSKSNELQNLVHPKDLPILKESLELLASESKDVVVENEFRIQDSSGNWRWVHTHDTIFAYTEAGLVKQVFSTIEDITERKKLEQQLAHDALYDHLTGLANRALFMDRLNKSLEKVKAEPGYLFAVLFLDVDRFKIINDSLGHSVGDQLLVVIAQRLQMSIPSQGIVSRLGGDEFTILIENITNIAEVIQIAQKIQSELSQSFALGRNDIFVTSSIGIALSSADYDKTDDILRDADTAMYQAKIKGRARYEVFDKAMHTQAIKVLQLEADLRKAVERGEFCLYYQPIISLKTGLITGCEALVRWKHPKMGVIGPSEFISIAEETGLIIQIDQWALQTAVFQNKYWQDLGFRPITVTVNLSTHQLKQKSLPGTIKKVLENSKLNPSLLELEITEGVVIENPETAIEILHELRNIGVKLSVDDFGTGYSSLTYLKRLPLNVIKLDRSFVQDITTDSGSAAIARAIISLAHILNLEVIAEGVEKKDQLQFLQKCDCDNIQGFLFSQPLESAEITKLFEKNLNRNLFENIAITGI